MENDYSLEEENKLLENISNNAVEQYSISVTYIYKSEPHVCVQPIKLITTWWLSSGPHGGN